MGTLGNPKTWGPYLTPKECTNQICSLSCPQWCYLIFPPPPPLTFPDDKSPSGPNFSPLVIGMIGILASAFLLISYYAIISKYCGNSSTSRRGENHPQDGEIDEEVEGNIHDHEQPSHHEPWFISTRGLDEALIKNITLVKYKKGDGLIGSNDCSVCLGEFLEEDSLRLLPKCSHAFHVNCIDTWLKSHSNCPLCRANIVSTFVQPIHPPHILVVDNSNLSNNDQSRDNESLSRSQAANDEISLREGSGDALRKSPFRTLSDLGGARLSEDISHHVRRSISMDHVHETHVSISNLLRFNHGDDHGDDCQVEVCELHDGSLKMQAGESSKSEYGHHTTTSSNSTTRVLHSVINSVTPLKRSFSSGRFLFGKHGRGSSAVIPV